MRVGRLAVVAVSAAAVGALATGCGTQNGAPGTSNAPVGQAPPAAQPVGEPIDQLKAAIDKLLASSFSFNGTLSFGTNTGVADPVHKSGTVHAILGTPGTTSQSSPTIDAVVVGDDLYYKINGFPIPGVEPGTYYHLMAGKLTSKNPLGINVADPSEAATIAAMIVTGEKSGTGGYQGTLDLTKAPAVVAAKGALDAMGDAARSVPFEATVDDQGRLTSFSYTVPAFASVKAIPVHVTYSDFGTAPAVTKPPADQIKEASDQLYNIANGTGH